VRALDNRGIRVASFKPIGQPVGHDTGPERSTYFIRRLKCAHSCHPITLEEAGRMIVARRTDELLERVVRDFTHRPATPTWWWWRTGRAERQPECLRPELAARPDAERGSDHGGIAGAHAGLGLRGALELAANPYGGFGGGRVIGCLVNRVPVPPVKDGQARGAFAPDLGRATLLSKPELNVIGAVPENPELTAYRTIDIAKHLEAETLHAGEISTRRVKKVSLLARTVPNLLTTLTPGSVLITPAIGATWCWPWPWPP